MKRTDIGVGIGGVMAALGVFIAVRLLAFGRAPLTGTGWLDLAFAAFFLVRGGLQYRRWRQAREAGSGTPHE
jgi:hypothetical protein